MKKKKTPTRFIITCPSEQRAILLAGMVAVAEGKMNTKQANAIASLSGEVHRSLELEWDMRCYVEEHLFLEEGAIIRI